MKYISVSSGSSGNCHFVKSGSTCLIIDAGISGKRIEDGLSFHDENLKKVNGIFVTHEHIDHIQGVGVISRKYDIPIYATEGTWENMVKTIGKIASHNIKEIKAGKKVDIDEVRIEAFRTSHDAKDSCGFTVTNGKKILAIATDLGYVSDEVFKAIEGANMAVVESNYDPEMLKFSSYPVNLKTRIRSEVGHLSNMECAFLSCALAKAGTERILLAHLSKENNMPLLAYQTVEEVLKSHGITGSDVGLDVLRRDKVSNVYSV
ncbi:MAG: MBL fold metallo-hydrolase [Filifactoraceae bacterium]